MLGKEDLSYIQYWTQLINLSLVSARAFPFTTRIFAPQASLSSAVPNLRAEQILPTLLNIHSLIQDFNIHATSMHGFEQTSHREFRLQNKSLFHTGIFKQQGLLWSCIMPSSFIQNTSPSNFCSKVLVPTGSPVFRSRGNLSWTILNQEGFALILGKCFWQFVSLSIKKFTYLFIFLPSFSFWASHHTMTFSVRLKKTVWLSSQSGDLKAMISWARMKAVSTSLPQHLTATLHTSASSGCGYGELDQGWRLLRRKAMDTWVEACTG